MSWSKAGKNDWRRVAAGLTLGVAGTVVGIVMLFPAMDRLSKSSAKSKDHFNIRRAYIGFHYHQEANPGQFSPFVVGADGEPNRGLSWRVSALPFIDQGQLYRQFQLGHAWDSAANQQPAQASVKDFLSSGDPKDNQTRFCVFVGPGALFEDATDWRKKGSLRGIPDGTSNTLFAVEAADRVPWASQKDIPYQPGGPLPALGHPDRELILVVMCDGSARYLKKTISPEVLRALITRSGGEAVTPPDW
jgi:hypothetical protein